MTYNFILNGEDVMIECEVNIRLIDILRGSFGLMGAKKGCSCGRCGACSIIFNGRVSPACLIPAFIIQGSEIITIEGFSQTEEYKEIITGFKQANLKSCGYCETGKIFCIDALLGSREPTKEEIFTAFNGINCRCTDSEKLIEAVGIAARLRQRRLNGGRI